MIRFGNSGNKVEFNASFYVKSTINKNNSNRTVNPDRLETFVEWAK